MLHSNFFMLCLTNLFFFLLKSIIEVVSTVLIANDKAECITFPVLILVSNNMVYKDILFKQFFSLETRYYS